MKIYLEKIYLEMYEGQNKVAEEDITAKHMPEIERIVEMQREMGRSVKVARRGE